MKNHPEESEYIPLEEMERRAIPEALNAAGGNKSEAARYLGITRKTLRSKLEEYDRTG